MKTKAEKIFIWGMAVLLAGAFIMTIVEGIQVARVLGILIADAAELGML